MSLKLYGYWRSSATYRARIALNLKALEYEYVPVHLVKDGGEHFSDNYSKMNPAHLVPTFVDDDEDVLLNQSMAIIEYIDEKYDTGVPLLPPHRLSRARVRAAAQDMACDIQPLQNLRVLKRLAEQFDAGEADRNTWSRHWIETGLVALEQRLVTTAGEFCFGFDVSMADVVLVPQLYNAVRYDVDMSQLPIICRIWENCNKLEAFQRALPENQIDAQ